MIATLAAKAPLITWMADDGYYYPGALKRAVDLWKETINPRNVVNLRYREGPNFEGPDKPTDYWMCHHHSILQTLPGILPHYKLLLMGLLSKQYFMEIGGLDCRYEYLNLNLNDLGIRIQKDGGEVNLLDGNVLTVDWVSDPDRLDEFGKQDATIVAFHENDLGVYINDYNTSVSDRIKIDYNNWMDADPIWRRRRFNNINQFVCE